MLARGRRRENDGDVRGGLRNETLGLGAEAFDNRAESQCA